MYFNKNMLSQCSTLTNIDIPFGVGLYCSRSELLSVDKRCDIVEKVTGGQV